MSARSVLVVVGDSLVGAALVQALRADGCSVYATTRRPDVVSGTQPFLDLAEAVETMPELPDVDSVILAAAVARLGACEDDPVRSRRVNVDGTLAVARVLARRGAHVVLLSTDKVFDGALRLRRRDDATCPRSVYGRQKAEAEGGVLALGREPGEGQAGAVLRLTKVLMPRLPLLADWLGELRAGRPITPFSDLRLAPISMALIVNVVRHIVAERANGIFHCSGREDRTYADLATAMARRLGLDEALIKPTEATDAAVPAAARVPYTSLEMELERSRWGIDALPFDDCVERLLG